MDPQVDEPQEHVAPTDAMRDAVSKIAELRAYAQQYFSAKADQWKLPGSHIAPEIRDLQRQGAKIIEANVPFMQSYPEQPTVRREVQELLRQAQ